MSKFCRLYYRIPFSETDQMAIVHHSNHARYLERGRVEFLRLIGLGYAEVVKRGLNYPVLELSNTFKKPLVFDEVILIETQISLASKTRLNFAYKIYSVPEMRESTLESYPFEGTPSVLGETHHCCVDKEGRPTIAPEDIIARLQEMWGGNK